ncbi:MAG TPA: hypothetical protein VJA18_00075 [Candidatus Nanoarchaeia archaeon]|nr:hypothetical protein [Candidatus Nanoarchaeia archaeon]
MPLSTSEVAEKSNMHWKTAERHLNSLVTKKLVIKSMEEERPFWELNFEKIQDIKKKLQAGADSRMR